MPTSAHGLYLLFFSVVGLVVSSSLAAVLRLLWAPQGHLQVPRMCVSSEAALFSQHRQEGPQQECVPLGFHPILQQESRGSPNIQEYTRNPTGWSYLSGSAAAKWFEHLACLHMASVRVSGMGKTVLSRSKIPSSTLTNPAF